MHPTLRIVLAFLAGIVIGSLVNMGLVSVGSSFIPAPAGVDVSTMEGLKASLPLFEPKHFVFPFLAHALGTLAGAFMAAWLAQKKGMLLAMIIGGLFFMGGLANILMLPSPLWFSILDLSLAYLPMGYLGAIWAKRLL